MSGFFDGERPELWERIFTARNEALPCLAGCDFVRGPDWTPLKKTRKGWEQYGTRAAKTQAVKNPVVAFIGARGCFRLSFAGQEERTR